MPGYPGEFLISMIVNCLIIITLAVKLKVDDVAKEIESSRNILVSAAAS